MNEVVITEKAKLIEKVQKQWEVTQGNEEADYSQLTVFLRWAKVFCEGSLIEIKIKNTEDALDNARKTANKAAVDLKRAERLVSEIEQNNFTSFHNDVL